MNNYEYSLQKDKKLADKITCFGCGEKRKLTNYVHNVTGEKLPAHVGICDRSDSCGYHYTPSDYFKENPDNKPTDFTPFTIVPAPPKREPSYVDRSVFEKSLGGYDKNVFTQFIASTFGSETAKLLIDKYRIGTTKNGATIFYQLSVDGKVRSGKIIQYNIIESLDNASGKDCKRDKSIMPWWVHKASKLDDFVLSQCLFGEHLLTDKSKTICIVESEKSAVIASIFQPQFTWLSCGGKEGLGTTKIQVSTRYKLVYVKF